MTAAELRARLCLVSHGVSLAEAMALDLEVVLLFLTVFSTIDAEEFDEAEVQESLDDLFGAPSDEEHARLVEIASRF